jgi:fatty-acid desaturase
MPKFGYQNFKTTDLSQNVWFVAIASFGEGWHNNLIITSIRNPPGTV